MSPQPRSKSATPLDNASSSKRKSLPKQHSYQKPTESSSAKLGASSPSKGRFNNKKAGGKLNSAMKSKFKSTPDLASLKTEELKPMPMSKTVEDIQELSQNKKSASTVRRSMPATREMKDPFGVSTPAVEPEDISSSKYQMPKSDRKVSIGESKVIDESKIHRKLPTPGVPNQPLPPSALAKSQSDVSIVSKARQSVLEEDEDRLKMPPPPPPPTTSSSKRSSSELTLAQAKAILLGGANSSTNGPTTTNSDSAKSSPEREQSAPVPVPTVSPPKVVSKPSEGSLDVPLEGSPDKETATTPGGGRSVFNRWGGAQEVMPLDLPVKDQSPSRFSWSSRRYGRMSGLNKPSVGECDDGGADEEEPAEGDADNLMDTSSTSSSSRRSADMSPRRSSDMSPLRRDRSQSPRRDSVGSSSSVGAGGPSGSPLTSPPRGRASLPSVNSLIGSWERTATSGGDMARHSPSSSGHGSPLHSPRPPRRHLRKSDEGPLPLSHDLQVAFTGDLGEGSTSNDPHSRENSALSPPLPPQSDPPLSIPKSKSMPEVGTDDKALEELCQSVTAKLDALANKPLPSRLPKTPPHSASAADRSETGRRKAADPTPGAVAGASGGSPDTEGDVGEIKRPDKSRTMPPTSLTTSLPSPSR